MRASELQHPLPVVGRDTDAVEAARLIAVGNQPGLVIADAKGNPSAVVSAVDVLGLLVPAYVLDDLALAGVMDEKAAEEVWAHASERTIGDLLDDKAVRIYTLLTVDADATILEVAAQMADARAQVAMVAGGSDPQFITLPVVVEAILRFCAKRSDG